MADGTEQNPETPPEPTAAVAQQPGCGAFLHYLVAILASLLGIGVLMFARAQHPTMIDPASPVAVFLGLASLAVGFSRSAQESVRYRDWVGFGVLTLLAMPAVLFPVAVYCPQLDGWAALAPLALILIVGGWFGRQRWLAFVVAAMTVFAVTVVPNLGPAATVPARDLYLASGVGLAAFGGVPALAAIVLSLAGRIRAGRGEDTLRLRVLAAGSLFAAAFALMTFLASLTVIPYFADERDRSNTSECITNLHSLCIAMRMYAEDHQGRLPPADSWSDAMLSYVSSRSAFVCRAVPQLRSGYAFNRALGRVRLSEIADPEHTVLLYESDLGWNGAGGADTVAWRHGGSSFFVFADGDFELVNRGEEGSLIWQPQRTAKAKSGTGANRAPGPDRARFR
jgi:hypothetical protein